MTLVPSIEELAFSAIGPATRVLYSAKARSASRILRREPANRTRAAADLSFAKQDSAHCQSQTMAQVIAEPRLRL